MINEAFVPQQLAADIRTTHDLYADLFSRLSAADWQRPTETDGWTVRETIAHLDAAAWAYQQIIEAILSNNPIDFAGFGIQQRQDLFDLNARQIALRQERPIGDICASFLATLQTAAASAAERQTAELGQSHPFPVYNRDISLAELYAGQTTHPGLVHAAQVANGAGVSYLWRQYDLPLLKRQITYLLHLMSLSYWPEKGKMQTVINFVVPRQASWHLRLSLKGCELYAGTGKRPPHRASAQGLTIWFRTLDALCRSLTLQMSPLRAALTGQVFAWGNLPLIFRLEHLFNPTDGL